MKIKNNKAFSLVELLVVITIIAILSVVAYTAVGGQTIKARNSKRQQDLTSIQAALELFAIENNNKYPKELDDGKAGSTDDLVPKYMPKMAVDPATKQKYSYLRSGNDRKYQLATTLEDENGNHKAYVIGNADTDTITGAKSCGKVKDGGTCLPYEI